ncbi:MAG TPA: SPFH domain-containing protein, partial [Abditibacteriaceae bacterium]|nr:SPFH domain-containing protein [Abditibacteriaceae bacterium]
MDMNREMLIVIGVIAGAFLVGLIVVGMIMARLYRRATKELSFVRTGFGGQKVIMNGGAPVFPVLHDTILVNMNTLRLEVQRSKEQALITKDRMRVDVQAEFYVRVKPTVESIADAAQTLGQKTLKPLELKELVEGKFVDALRSVAAEMSMEELHEMRTDFVQKVQAAVTGDLMKNGLELETVSLTALDQTSRDYFNPNNAFDAQGLT